jgi:hypothetical protein
MNLKEAELMRRILVILALMIAALVIVREQAESNGAISDSDTQREVRQWQNQPGGVVVMQVFYYAKPGKADEVLSHRQHASDVLEKLNLPRGRVMRRAGSSDELPDVMWECEFANAAARDQFLKAATASPEFEEVRKHMATLIRSAERRDWEVQESPRLRH